MNWLAMSNNVPANVRSFTQRSGVNFVLGVLVARVCPCFYFSPAALLLLSLLLKNPTTV